MVKKAHNKLYLLFCRTLYKFLSLKCVIKFMNLKFKWSWLKPHGCWWTDVVDDLDQCMTLTLLSTTIRNILDLNSVLETLIQALHRCSLILTTSQLYRIFNSGFKSKYLPKYCRSSKIIEPSKEISWNV